MSQSTKQVLSQKMFALARKLRLGKGIQGTRKYRREGQQLEVELKLFRIK